MTPLWKRVRDALVELGTCGHLQPCSSCLTRLLYRYEERIQQLEDKRVDAAGWPLRDTPEVSP